MTGREVAVVLLAVAAVGLSACTSPPNAPPPSSPPPSSSARPTDREPEDRDQEAVLAAVRSLDLCALTEEAMTAEPLLPATATLHSLEPFQCSVLWPDGILSVEVASRDERMESSSREQVIGDARAYVRDRENSCDVFLPVSSTQAIWFSYDQQGRSGACRPASDLAAAAARALADPDIVRMDPMWDACTVLAEAVGPDVDRTKLQGDRLSNCTDNSEMPFPGALTFSHSVSSQGQPEVRTVGGRQVRVYEEDGSCDVYWRQGPFTARFAEAPDYQVHVIAPDCARSTALAESAMRLLDTPPPTDVEPQRPVLYPAD